MTALAETQQLVHPETGELLPATVESAAVVLAAARRAKQRLDDLIRQASDVVVAESERLGSRTLRVGDVTLTVTGGRQIVYDAQALVDGLCEAQCPQERIDEAVAVEVSYRIDRRVLRQLASANREYADAIEAAARVEETPLRVRVVERPR